MPFYEPPRRFQEHSWGGPGGRLGVKKGGHKETLCFGWRHQGLKRAHFFIKGRSRQARGSFAPHFSTTTAGTWAEQTQVDPLKGSPPFLTFGARLNLKKDLNKRCCVHGLLLRATVSSWCINGNPKENPSAWGPNPCFDLNSAQH